MDKARHTIANESLLPDRLSGGRGGYFDKLLHKILRFRSSNLYSKYDAMTDEEYENDFHDRNW